MDILFFLSIVLVTIVALCSTAWWFKLVTGIIAGLWIVMWMTYPPHYAEASPAPTSVGAFSLH